MIRQPNGVRARCALGIAYTPVCGRGTNKATDRRKSRQILRSKASERSFYTNPYKSRRQSSKTQNSPTAVFITPCQQTGLTSHCFGTLVALDLDILWVEIARLIYWVKKILDSFSER